MKNVIITGASGMIGQNILQQCLSSEQIDTVTSICRRPSGRAHPKLKEIIHTDFLNYTAVEDHFSNQDIAFFCVGVYTGQFPDEIFKQITVDFTIAFADTLNQKSPSACVCFLSGAGADLKEKSSISFARYKGMAENHLINKNFDSLYLFRPGYIYPVEKREEPNFSYHLMRRLYPLIKLLGKKHSVTSEQLGTAMFRVALNGADKMILENQDIVKLGSDN